VIHIFEYLEDKVLLIFSSYTFQPNMFVLQHFQLEVSLFDMFRCLSYVQPISAVGSYFQLCSALKKTTYFKHIQLFSAIYYLFFSFKLSDVSIPMHFQQEMHFLVVVEHITPIINICSFPPTSSSNQYIFLIVSIYQ